MHSYYKVNPILHICQAKIDILSFSTHLWLKIVLYRPEGRGIKHQEINAKGDKEARDAAPHEPLRVLTQFTLSFRALGQTNTCPERRTLPVLFRLVFRGPICLYGCTSWQHRWTPCGP